MQEFLVGYMPAVEVQKSSVEPRVVTADVTALLKSIVRPDDDDAGASVSLVAEKASTSTRTVYRVLSESTPTINLDLADRLCLAADSHLAACRLSWPNGKVTSYDDVATTVE